MNHSSHGILLQRGNTQSKPHSTGTEIEAIQPNFRRGESSKLLYRSVQPRHKAWSLASPRFDLKVTNCKLMRRIKEDKSGRLIKNGGDRTNERRAVSRLEVRTADALILVHGKRSASKMRLVRSARGPVQQSRRVDWEKSVRAARIGVVYKTKGTLTEPRIGRLARVWSRIVSISMSLEYLLLYLPLLVSVSFVVGATRHEQNALILDQTRKTAVWITGFMLTLYVILQIVSWST